MSSPATLAAFRRHVDAAAGIYARIDSGVLQGRNAESTDMTLAWHVRAARELIAADARTDTAPICTWLDARPRSAARWNRIERRFYGLST